MKCLITPTGRGQTSWLFTQHSRGVEKRVTRIECSWVAKCSIADHGSYVLRYVKRGYDIQNTTELTQCPNIWVNKYYLKLILFHLWNIWKGFFHLVLTHIGLTHKFFPKWKSFISIHFKVGRIFLTKLWHFPSESTSIKLRNMNEAYHCNHMSVRHAWGTTVKFPCSLGKCAGFQF